MYKGNDATYHSNIANGGGDGIHIPISGGKSKKEAADAMSDGGRQRTTVGSAPDRKRDALNTNYTRMNQDVKAAKDKTPNLPNYDVSKSKKHQDKLR